MRYISTRGGMQPANFSETLLEGLAPDGGLAVPETLPKVSIETLNSWRGLNYAELATEVLHLFASDIAKDDLQKMCQAAYSLKNFSNEFVVPLTPIEEGITLVGLSEGPTLAFKDMAMQFLGQALEYALAKTGRVLNVLGATSGDTGSAAEYALRGKEGIGVFMLSPAGRMSDFQRAQMYSLTDENVHNISVDGVFDDCQNLMKELAADLDFKREVSLGAVNSVNLGRISAQAVYYFWAWLRASDSAENTEDFKISVTVPTGNFGNIMSGYFAREMGVPIKNLVLAANENNVLDEFFRTGVYRPRSASNTYQTSSPSMDISKASNLERFIFEFVSRDPKKLSELWQELDSTGQIDLSAEKDRLQIEFGFFSGSSTHQDRVQTIKSVYEKSGVIIDPHTADGVKVARQHLEEGVPMLVLETAKPQKFAETVTEAIGKPAPMPEHLADLLELPQYVQSMPNDAQELRDFILLHRQR